MSSAAELELDLLDSIERFLGPNPKKEDRYLTVIGLLQQVLLNLLPPSATPIPLVSSLPQFLVVSITGASTATSTAPPGTLVKAALVQNISANNVTLGNKGVAVGAGYILNAATGTGSAGDTVTIVPPPGADLVDLSLIFFNQTGTGATLAVFYFQ